MSQNDQETLTRNLQGGRTESVDDKPPVQNAPISRIGRYRILSVLGKGGFGMVYQARDEQLDRLVAVKVPHARHVTRAEDAAPYLQEARTVANLDHPQIVPVYDVGSSSECLCYIVSKFVDGKDLVALLREKRLSHREAAELVAQVAETLHYAHKMGIVHRDIKPGNILIDQCGKTYIVDFGLAVREQDAGAGATRFAGTPAYMSPEQARGEGHRLDGRSDIYSLGAVFYELLTNRRKSSPGERGILLDQIAIDEPRPPRQIDDAIPKELERICLKALAFRATERYSTALDLAEDLRAFLREGGDSEPTINYSTDVIWNDPDSAAISRKSRLLESGNQSLRIVPKGLRSFDEQDADFFLKLLPGSCDRHGLPECVRFWKSRIEEQDAESTFPVGVIYGPSGCGKSSMVKAGLLPRLSSDVLTIYIEATPGDTEKRLLNGLRKRCPDLIDDWKLTESIAALRRGYAKPSGKKILIVLDQFEQWLHCNRDSENLELVQALRHCDGGNVQCVVMVRDDFWMAITRFMRDLEMPLREGVNSAGVDLFPVPHAEKVLAALGRAFGTLPADARWTTAEQMEFFRQAVSGLAEDGRVTCIRLVMFAEMMKSRAWTPAALQDVGGTQGVGVTFLEETFSAASAPLEHRAHQRAARAILKSLLPLPGTDIKGQMQSYEELLEASGYSSRPREFQDLIRILDTDLRLITPTDPEGLDPDDESQRRVRSGQKYFQLTHDYLVPSLRDWLTRKQKESRRGRAELRLAECADNWNSHPEHRRLPTSFEHLAIRLLTDRRQWTPNEQRMMQSAARVHGVRWVAAIVMTLVVVLSIQGFLSAQSVKLARQQDESDRKQTELLVDAVLSAPADALPYAIQNLQPFRAHALKQLESLVDSSSLSPVQQLRAMAVLAEFGDARIPSLIAKLETIPADECNTLVEALQRDPKLAVVQLTDCARIADTAQNWSSKARCGILLLHLGHSEVAAEMAELRADPAERMEFIETAANWHGRVDRLVNSVNSSVSAALRSGICLGLGSIPASHLTSAELNAVVPVLTHWFVESPDAGTHSAAGWVLRQWNRPLPVIASGSSPGGDREWQINNLGMTLIRVPAAQPGRAIRGGKPSTPSLPEFWLGDREISRQQYQTFMDDPDYPAEAKPKAWDGADTARSHTGEHPVQNVSWRDAVLFCNWLSAREQLTPCYRLVRSSWELDPTASGYRLPLEAEWEHACRAATKTWYVCGNDESLLDRFAVFESNHTAICAQKMPNGWGLFDMHGNVYEWCQDLFLDHENSDPAIAPAEQHSIRGGAYDYVARYARSFEQAKNVAGYRSRTIGFRVARNP